MNFPCVLKHILKIYSSLRGGGGGGGGGLMAVCGLDHSGSQPFKF